MQKIFITAQDGYPLSALTGTSIANKGTIIVSSATCIKKEFYLKFGEFLLSSGYNVILFDYRGIGGSAPESLKNSKIFMHEWGTKDMNAVLNYAISIFGTEEIIWIGHSVGAQLVGFLEQAHHIKKVISINAALGYWGFFPFPMNVVVWTLWYIIYPLMIKVYGYGAMQKIGWGENLPINAIKEWRKWCISKTYYRDLLQEKLKEDNFKQFTRPITVIYTSDDYIANDNTVPLMMQFFPNAPKEVIKISVAKFTNLKVGHAGIFRKKFESTLWPILINTLTDKNNPQEFSALT
jgi:predicted alpha/beta hydrolase